MDDMADFLWRARNALRRVLGLRAQARACCRDAGNLGPDEPGGMDPRLTFRRCRTCGSRHFELSVDPGRLGVRAG